LNLILDNSVVYVEYGRLVTKADYLLRIKHQEPSNRDRAHYGARLRQHGDRCWKLSGNATQSRYAHRHALALRRYMGLQEVWLGADRGWLNACPGLEKSAVITSLSFSSLFSGHTDDFHGAQQSRRHQFGIRLVEFRRRKGIGLRNIGLTVANDAVDPRVRDFDLHCVLPRF
jgi:hypothetical protein